MKRKLKVILTALVLAMLPTMLSGQVKMYTKKARMADFLTKTTKVVISSGSPVESALKSEIVSCWRVSPYEFCDVDEYEKLCTRADFYFMRLVIDDGITFLSLSKGGDDTSEDNFIKPFEVARIPVAAEGQVGGPEMMFLGAYIEMIQSFAEKSMTSDRIAYSGIGASSTNFFKNKRIILDEEAASEAFMKGEFDTLIPVFVQSATSRTCYKMLISADSHELIYFNKSFVKHGQKASFSETELKSFEKKDAEIVR